MTIGIGLRARRGVAQVGFWGFCLTDGRRVGKDFFLYDTAVFDREGDKIPLDRTALEAAIGAGGKVVRDQGEYRKLVNQTLFGFADDQAYKDFLTLLIQLRSPKLSKEFRPTTIYSILNGSLPPLGDEDLRPLSEVLQDMDEISDRLDELVLHQGSAKRLDDVYQRYNQMWLFETAKRVIDASKATDEVFQAVTEQTAKLDEVKSHRNETDTSLQAARYSRDKTEQELASFEHSEAMDVQMELDSTKARVQDTESDWRATEQRLQTNRDIEQQKRLRMDDDQRKLEGLLHEQSKSRRDMDDLAKDVEFVDHAAYNTLADKTAESIEEATWQSWNGDVDAYRKALTEARRMCAEEQLHADRARDAERSMSEARVHRDACEQTLQARERALEQAKDQQEDAWFAWFKGLTVLPLSEMAWRQLLHGLRQYGMLAYDRIIAPAREALASGTRDATEAQLRLEHERKLKVAERAALQQELEEWKTVRNPEPQRSIARSTTRHRRLDGIDKPIGAPLYMVCDFYDDVDEITRAALETALHQSGLLDAWVSPDRPRFMDGDEDVWLKPNPALLRHTLADYLKPTPPTDSGLTVAEVDEALRTIEIGEESEDASHASVTPTGRYVLGPLTGQSLQKEQAEWIGFEARKRARAAKIDRLQSDIVALTADVEGLDAQVAVVLERIALMQTEYASLPTDDDLRVCLETFETAKRDFAYAQDVEKNCTEAYRDAKQKWQTVREALLTYTHRWQSLRSATDFEDALELLRQYDRALQGLHVSVRLSQQTRHDMAYLQEEVDQLAERIDDDLRHQRQLEMRQQTLADKISSLYKRLEDLGMVDVYEQQQQLKEALAQWRKRVDELQEALRKCEKDYGVLEERVQVKQEELTRAEAALEGLLSRFHAEWDLQLADLDKTDVPVPDEIHGRQAVLKAARLVHHALRSRCEQRNLQQVASQLQESFALEKNTLLDYALASEFDVAKERVFVLSGRDRNKPWTPRQVYQELSRQVDEQRVLISEKDRELYEQILIHSVGRAIRDKINRAEQWVKQINRIMSERKTSSKLVLSLEWKPRPAQNEREIDTERLVYLLRKSPSTMLEEEMEDMIEHFRSRIRYAKEEAEQSETLSKWIQELLDYRQWFSFTLYFRKGTDARSELTDSKFNVLSGGEKAMAMYIPLFAATDSRFNDGRPEAPRIISLDEAFAGVDEENVRDMFQLLTEMEFDYMMTSQQIWGCYDTVPSLSIYELYRPEGVDYVTVFPYYWNGHTRKLMDDDFGAMKEIAATLETTTSSTGPAASE